MIPIPQALRTCSTEPIHIPGAIQPFGVLLAFTGSDGVCTQASANCGELLPFGIDEVLGRSIREIFGEGAVAIEEACAADDPWALSPLFASVGERRLEVGIHRHGGTLILELEPCGGDADPSRHFRLLQKALAEMRAADSAASLHDFVARFVANFTGYERVMVYRFDKDWHGEVVGECLLGPVDSYMGLHFPASDIPEQARALYTRNWLRIIPDAGYTPVRLVPELDPVSGGPLDLGKAALRSVSPVHLEYLRNMDVGASMSISLIVDGRLWGLIACHHRKPRPLPVSVRAACELFGQIASREIEGFLASERQAARIRAARIQTSFFDVIASEKTFFGALTKYTPELLEFMGADGAAIVSGGQITLVGRTPDKVRSAALVDWLRGELAGPVWSTDAIGEVYPRGGEIADTASGVLALKLSPFQDDYVVWFRPEVVRTVTWAGNPAKPQDPDLALHPRKSFAAWKETLRGTSLPWQETEIEAARELRHASNAMLLRRTQSLTILNAELEKKNTDLNSFAYIASHDLREPLRGMSQYATFILEDHRPTLAEDAVRRLEMIRTLAVRCEELIETLNRFSRVGRMELTLRPFSLEDLVSQVIDALAAHLAEQGAEVRVIGELPVLPMDPVLLREVFSNLITNGIRYNDRERKVVEIGFEYAGDGAVEVFVRDNGIGIPEKHYDNVFRIFRRLHEPEAYGGGSGAGLAIVKAIVERHGGSIRVESEVGAGTTFTIRLNA